MQIFLNNLRKIGLNKIIKENIALSSYTSFKIGGKARILIEPRELDELVLVMKEIRKNFIPYFIIGKGTNLLVSDNGINGAIIKLSDNFMEMDLTSFDTLEFKSGTLLSEISDYAYGLSLSGMEFASGIPGTLGGAIYMNAGAYGKSMSDMVKRVSFLDEDFNLQTLENKDLNFGYRKSIFQEKNFIIVSAEIGFTKTDQKDISELLADFSNRRAEKQPLKIPSAGSAFKRPQGSYASKLIQDSFLKGIRYRGASISSKHSGFLVNDDNASADDVMKLVEFVQKIVEDDTGIRLERELKFLDNRSLL